MYIIRTEFLVFESPTQETLMANTKTPPIRVEMKFRNNIILTMMEEMGIVSMAQLVEQTGMSRPSLDNIINMRASPLREDGGWINSVVKLAEFFGCSPDEMFSEEQIQIKLAKNRAFAEVTFSEVQKMIASDEAEQVLPDKALEESEIRQLVESLTGNNKRVICLRFGIGEDCDHTLEEVAQILGVTRERIRQIEVRALRVLCTRAKYGQPVMEAETEPREYINFSEVVAAMAETK